MSLSQTSSKIFTNHECEYYPCHTHIHDINCLFCFCPLYYFKECGGNPSYTSANIKDCTGCTFPHHMKNYDEVIERIKEYTNGVCNK